MPLNGSASVDHFVPKSLNSKLAYEWDNFRLTTCRVNSHKDNATDVMDPIGLPVGLFEINFRTFHVVVASSAPLEEQQRALATIERLQLNDDDILVNARVSWLRAFVAQPDIDFLRQKAPFLALELERQGALPMLQSLFKRA